MYVVPGMKLIPQLKTRSCWYASAKMLIQWKMNSLRQSFIDLVPPELDAECRTIREADNGIFNPQIMAMAKRLGLRPIPPMSFTINALEQMLIRYGPLWVNGETHIVVIAGVNGEAGKVLVYDPGPVNIGSVSWRSYRDWYLNASPFYTIKPGDTLSSIAKKRGVTWQQIYSDPKNNDFRKKRPNPNLIYPGDKVFIPSADAVSSRDTSNSVEAVFLYVP